MEFVKLVVNYIIKNRSIDKRVFNEHPFNKRDNGMHLFDGKLDGEALEQIKDSGLSPFKAEIAAFIKRSTVVVPIYQEEVNKLAKISEKSIAGVITTNYDSFLEDVLGGFTKYIGQTQLIFSAIQGIAEIYKIHGSVENPDSIVINESDYVKFDNKRAYLAAKLMTIFMEYPIVFMGYSISDVNVQNIIKSIVNCLDLDAPIRFSTYK